MYRKWHKKANKSWKTGYCAQQYPAGHSKEGSGSLIQSNMEAVEGEIELIGICGKLLGGV